MNACFCLPIYFAFLGISMGMSYTSGYSYFIPYFDKHIAVAYLLTAASTGIGFLTLPPLFELLVRTYSWRGALQITAAIMTNICVCGVLLRPSLSHKPTSIDKKAKPRPITENGFQRLPESSEPSSLKMSCAKFLKDISADFDLQLFRNVRFLFTCIIGSCLIGGTTGFTIYLVPYAVSVGISETNASLLLLVWGISIVIGRLSPVGWIVDKQILSAATVGAVGNLTLGTVMIVTPFITNFTHLMLLCVVNGLSQSMAVPMLQIVIADSAGDKAKIQGAMAWYILAFGVGCLLSIFLAGKL